MRKTILTAAILLSASNIVVMPAQATSTQDLTSFEEKQQRKDAKESARAEKKAARALAKKEREAERQRKKAAREARLAEPRVRFRMNSVETAFRGVAISTDMTVYNAPAGPFGSASAELEILDANDNTLALEECTTAHGLPTKVETESYRLTCKISDKGVYSGSLVVFDLPFGTFTGSGRYTTKAAGAVNLPVGLGMISLEDSVAPKAGSDCQYSDWSAWDACNFFGNQSRTRSIFKAAESEGLVCDNNLLFETRSC